MAGQIFSIEGTDGSGKKTQSIKLYERFKEEGIPCEVMSFPNYDSPTGKIAGVCYLGKIDLGLGGSWFEEPTKLDPYVASLYFAADRRNEKARIEEILSSGKHLILNRYIESNMAHQGGKLRGVERKKFIDFMENLEYGLLEMPKPNKTIFLYIPTDITIKLREERNEFPDAHESSEEHLKNAEETYLELEKRFNWTRIICAPNGKVRHRESIAEEVYNQVIAIKTFKNNFS